MLFIDNQGINDPRINLALEEYMVRTLGPEEDYLLFYINQPSIIIGKHQNTVEEINASYVKEKDIIVVRRISGGGAVYHDLGNLNFSFLTAHDPKKLNNFLQFTKPIVEALKKLGVPAEMTGRNDIVADGRKISGNAQFSNTKTMFSHGTLLFDTELEDVVRSLNVSGEKITSKGIKSVRSRVANIKEFLKEPMTTQAFRDYILASIFEGHQDIPRYELSEQDWEAVHQLSKEKYQTWEWNYGRSPEFNIQKKKRFSFGEVDARLDVKGGNIQNIKFYGDFLGVGDLNILEEKLEGQRNEQSHLSKELEGTDLSYFFGQTEELKAAEFAEFLCD